MHEGGRKTILRSEMLNLNCKAGGLRGLCFLMFFVGVTQTKSALKPFVMFFSHGESWNGEWSINAVKDM
ncbi:hypothetical protein PVOR_21064 [Paenibacillus vortex V453]|uniref:Uncharacterized protein n=1 Tax=Paenibacillus vortex V453 TaxID=715225 RepID=A0A2R9SR33_9BACL|nr:hypothetical protein PVOR_21064 [Paenibacillus vortex V453]